MNIRQFIFKIPILILILGLPLGCSDSDNNNDTADTNTVSLSATLNSLQIVPEPADSTATATASITIDRDSLLMSGSLTVNNASSSVENVHVHEGFAGTTGRILISLEKGRNNVWNIPGDTVIATTQLDSLLAGGMYLSVHTQNYAGGELRGQIVDTNTQVLRVSLNGNNEVPPVTTNANGVGYVTVDTDGNIVANIRFNNITATNAHIHQGFAGTNGSITVQLNQNGNNPNVWEISDTLTETQLNDLFSGKLYFNVHTTANSKGEIRGPIVPSNITVIRTDLTGDQSAPPNTTTNGSGIGYVTVNTETRDIVANVQINSITATNAHIHQGAVGTNGDITIPLNEQNDGTWETDELLTLTTAQMNDLLNGNMYFNIHTQANPSGEIRGQIIPDVENEKPDVLTPSFEFIQTTVFEPVCGSCHSGPNASAGLDLNSTDTYDRLVTTQGATGVLFVEAGDPENSYLIQKLEGSNGIAGCRWAKLPCHKP
ncbi:MAG: CHRD domain-containing protein [Gammaproteobacteria bacterium]|nr:CHRD domain-containing protein [Gammaproteobacteria bacterium]